MKNTKNWSRLDNAAKIFPPTTTKQDTKVFRFVCELQEPVEGPLLQQALEQTLGEFPLYRSVLKKGLFWYYFEESGLHPVVREESNSPCVPLYSPDKPSLLFQVTYYHGRINLEIFHALADGFGAMQFLSALVCQYLALRYPHDFAEKGMGSYDASPDQRVADAFYMHYDRTQKIPGPKQQTAYRIRGGRLPDGRLGVMEAVTSTKAVLELAHQHKATLSEMIVALLILAIYDNMAVRDRKRPVIITVPVDLRRFFSTQTARNFFGVIKVGYNFSRNDPSLEAVLEEVHRSFSEQLTQKNLLGIINRYSAIENNPVIKAVPLFFKIPCLRLAGWWADKQDTAALSNVGRVVLPEEVAGRIRLFDVFLSTKRPQICLCSLGDTLAISVSSPLSSTDVPRSFFRRLVQMGIPVQIASNLDEKEENDEKL